MARTPRERSLSVAQHEAAHVVVGVALGLQLYEAVVGAPPDRPDWGGYAWFHVRRHQRTHYALTLAAGVAWEGAFGNTSPGDEALLRKLGYRGSAITALATAAAAMLATRGAAHSRVTRALLERDLTGVDLEALARGEALPDE